MTIIGRNLDKLILAGIQALEGGTATDMPVEILHIVVCRQHNQSE
jgi:hypothetical protein